MFSRGRKGQPPPPVDNLANENYSILGQPRNPAPSHQGHRSEDEEELSSQADGVDDDGVSSGGHERESHGLQSSRGHETVHAELSSPEGSEFEEGRGSSPPSQHGSERDSSRWFSSQTLATTPVTSAQEPTSARQTQVDPYATPVARLMRLLIYLEAPFERIVEWEAKMKSHQADIIAAFFEIQRLTQPSMWAKWRSSGSGDVAAEQMSKAQEVQLRIDSLQEAMNPLAAVLKEAYEEVGAKIPRLESGIAPVVDDLERVQKLLDRAQDSLASLQREKQHISSMTSSHDWRQVQARRLDNSAKILSTKDTISSLEADHIRLTALLARANEALAQANTIKNESQDRLDAFKKLTAENAERKSNAIRNVLAIAIVGFVFWNVWKLWGKQIKRILGMDPEDPTVCRPDPNGGRQRQCMPLSSLEATSLANTPEVLDQTKELLRKIPVQSGTVFVKSALGMALQNQFPFLTAPTVITLEDQKRLKAERERSFGVARSFTENIKKFKDTLYNDVTKARFGDEKTKDNWLWTITALHGQADRVLSRIDEFQRMTDKLNAAIVKYVDIRNEGPAISQGTDPSKVGTLIFSIRQAERDLNNMKRQYNNARHLLVNDIGGLQTAMNTNLYSIQAELRGSTSILGTITGILTGYGSTPVYRYLDGWVAACNSWGSREWLQSEVKDLDSFSEGIDAALAKLDKVDHGEWTLRWGVQSWVSKLVQDSVAESGRR